MSKTITTEVFQYDELSDDAKEKARNWYRGACEGDTFWSECTLEEAEAQGELLGITFARRKQNNPKAKGEALIYFSGFCSQGDGACFEGSWSAGDVQAAKVAEGWGESKATDELRRIASEFDSVAKGFPSASFTVKHRGHYYHEFCTEFDVSMYDDAEGVIQTEANAAEESLIEAARDFMRWIYRQLESEYEYQNSDETVEETIRANEYTFTGEGKRFG